MKDLRHYADTVWFWVRVWYQQALDKALAAVEQLVPARWLPKRCPCCGWRGLAFRGIVFGEYSRHGARCPRCNAFERHRAMALFYPRFFGTRGERPHRAIHFSAEPCLEATLRPLFTRYTRSSFDDLAPAEVRLDLMHLGLRDASCGVFLLHHVFEYPLDDRLAITELYRALDPAGVAIATIALDGETETVELRSIPSTGRRRAYGTRDLAERFRPFAVSVLNVAAELERATRRACGIPPRVHALVLRKTVSCEEGGA